MELRQLRLLRALGDLGSVTAVAHTVHLTPSAVSQQLRLLQQRCGVPLTRRHQRRLVLTEAGQRLAAAVADIESAVMRAEATARELADVPRGVVSVAAFNSAALAFFPPLVTAFPAEGAVSVAVADEDAAQADFPGLTARYDVVVGHRSTSTPPWPASVEAVALLDEPLDVALPSGHRLAELPVLTASDVADEPWIATHQGWPVGAVVDTLAAVSGRPVTVRHRVNEFTVVAELVRSGAGIALLPRWTTPPPDGVVLRALEGVSVSRRVDALTRPENAFRPEVRSVLEALVGIGRSLPGRGRA